MDLRLRQKTRGTLATFGLMLAAALVVAMRSLAGNGARAHEGAAHPAHIHAGTCETLGDVVAPLSDVGSDLLMDGTPMAGTEMMGPASALPVDASVTTVALPLADIIAGGHAINIHESAEEIQNYIACGDIGGIMMGENLIIGLGERNDSDYSGVAVLTDAGGSTTVAVYLTEDSDAEDDGEDDDATPAAGGSSTTAPAIAISGFAFGDGAPLKIAVGTTVTWTNQDDAPHTVSQVGGGFQSGKLDKDATFSHTFDTAGTVDYFCEYHANMKAQVIVT